MVSPTDLLPNPFDGIRDLLIGELAEEALGKPPEQYLSDVLVDAGFEPVKPPDVEAEHKSTASQQGATKLKMGLGEDEHKKEGSASYSVFGIALQAYSELETKTSVIEVDPAAKSAEFNAIEYEAEGMLHREKFAGAGSLIELGAVAVLAPAQFVASGPFAARVGDLMVHGGFAGPGPGSADVTIGGAPALRALDSHVCPAATPNPHGAGFFVSAITDVLINGRPAMRAGDYAWESVGPNPIVMGCPSVTIGPLAPPVDCQEVVMKKLNLIEWDGTAGIDFGYAIAKVKAGAGFSVKEGFGLRAKAEADVSAFRPWFDGTAAVNIPLNIDVDLPWLGRVQRNHLTLQTHSELELRLLTAGADGTLSTGRSTKGVGAAWARTGKQKLENNIDLRKAGQ